MSMDEKVSHSSLISPGINSWIKQRRRQLIIESFLTVSGMWIKSMAQKFNGQYWDNQHWVNDDHLMIYDEQKLSDVEQKLNKYGEQ